MVDLAPDGSLFWALVTISGSPAFEVVTQQLAEAATFSMSHSLLLGFSATLLPMRSVLCIEFPQLQILGVVFRLNTDSRN